MPESSPTNDTPQTRKNRWLAIAILIGLGVLTVLVASRDMTVGGFSWSDAPLHAMDGVFVHDFVCARPAGSYRAWAEQYYLKHQCLGIGVYYPPMFAAIEAMLFAMFGISVAVARLTVVHFVVAAVWLIFLLGREWFGTVAGIAAALLTLVSSAGVVWSRQVMLEWPSVFWIALALLAYTRLCRSRNWCWSIMMAGGCLGAYLTKQTAGFVIGVILVHAVLLKQWELMRRPLFYVPFGALAILIFAYAKATSGLNALAPMLIAGSPPWGHLTSVENWSWYIVRLPHMLGWPVTAAAFAVLATAASAALTRIIAVLSRAPQTVNTQDAENAEGGRDAGPPIDFPGNSRRHLAREAALPIFWALGWWVVSSLIAAKEERYFFFAIPAIALLIGWGIGEAGRRRTTSGAIVACFGWLTICAAVVMAVRTPALRLVDMRPTVAYLAGQSDADLVLVDAVRDGQLIFDVRAMRSQATDPPDAPAAHRPNSKIIPMRASKLLYSRAARTRYGYAQHVASPAEIVGLLDRLGMRYIVLEDRLPTAVRSAGAPTEEDRSWDTPPRLMLRELVLDSGRFERVFSQSLACDDPIWDNVNLVTYRYKNAPQRRTDTIRLSIPAMGKDVELTIEE